MKHKTRIRDFSRWLAGLRSSLSFLPTSSPMRASPGWTAVEKLLLLAIGFAFISTPVRSATFLPSATSWNDGPSAFSVAFPDLVLGDTLAGSPVIDRSSVDGAYQITFIDPLNVIPVAGQISTWQLWADATGTVKLEVFRPTAAGYLLIGENPVTVTSTGANAFTIPPASRIQVQPGDMLGFRYNGTGIITFDANSGGQEMWSPWPDGGEYDEPVGGTIPLGVMSSYGQGRTYSLGADIQTSLIITWTNPAAITYGIALGTNQLNATANLPGSFSYNPPAGTILNPGTNALSVIFTPTDTADYTIVTNNVSLVVSGSTTFDLTADFSASSNPNGVWSYDESDQPITQNQDPSYASGWGYYASEDSSILQLTAAVAGNDSQVGDVVMHAPSVPYGGPAAYLDINWTSPARGVISLSGRAWDDIFYPGRDANWWLSVGGTTIASRASVNGLDRSDPAAQFASNVLAGDTLAGIIVTQGEVVEIAVAADTYYGHFVGVQEDITLSPLPTPSIITQPTNQLVMLDGTAEFNVFATSDFPTAYQWYYNGASLAGQTSPALNLTNVQASQVGGYWVVITNVYGAVTSAPAVLTVQVANNFNFTGGLQSFTVPPGVFSLGIALAGGAGGLGGNDSHAGGAASAQLEASATLAVTPGQTLALSVGGGGAAGIGCGNYPGGVGGTSPLAGYAGGNGGAAGPYGCSGSGGGGGAATVIVMPDGGVIIAGGGGGAGGGGNFSVGYDGIASAVVLATNSQTAGGTGVSHPSDGGGGGGGGGGAVGGAGGGVQGCDCGADPGQGGGTWLPTNYLSASAVWSTSLGSYGGNGFITLSGVVTPSFPIITSPPTNTTVLPGETASLAVTASSAIPLGYQWLLNGANLTDNSKITGSQSNVLTLTDVTLGEAGVYQVVVTNALGSINAAATLTVPPTNPLITWSNPAGINYGTALSSVQLNATANLPGAFVYTPAAGAVLGVGTNTLTAVFTPTDTVDYTSVTNTVNLVVSGSSTYDLVGDFSTVANPNGVWSYGWATALGNPFQLATTPISINSGLGVGWYNGYNLPDTCLLIKDFAGYSFQSGTAGLNPDTLHLDPQIQAVVARFTSPGAGFAQVGGLFRIEDTGSHAHFLTIRLNGTTTLYSVFTGGAYYNENFAFNFATSLNPGDTLDFIVSCNGGDLYNLGTGLKATITQNYAPPVIVQSPASQNALVGSDVSLGVIASSPASLNYQWLWNGTNIATATNADYLLADVQTNQAGTYSVVVANAFGSVTSAPALLAVGFAPALTAQPADQMVPAGTSATFTVTATGSAPLNYQWAENGTALTGATNASLVLNNLLAANDGSYSVTVSNLFGVTNSQPATLTVLHGTPVVTWPAPAAITYGTPLGAGQLDAAANAPGGFAYTPSAGVQLNAGTNVLTAVFSPTDPADLNSVTTSVSLVVLPATLTVTASNYSRPYAQTNPVLGGTITGLANGDLITATYATTATSNSPAGTYPIIPTLADPGNRLANYTVLINNGTLTVTPLTPLITWASPSGITYGTALGGSQLDATANVPGTFAYSPAAGTVESAGTDALQAVFTPVDTTNYTTVTDTVSVAVSPVPLSVTAASATRPYGQANPTFTGTLVGLVNGDPITATFTSSATSTSLPGVYPIVPTLIDPENRLGDYLVSSTNGILTVTPVAPQIVTQPADESVLPGSNATVSVVAFGTPPLSYQWWFNETNALDLATNATLLLTNFNATLAGFYSVTVSNAYGSTNSALASLTISNVPDLAVTFVSEPAAGQAGQPIQIVYGITNVGTADAAAPWQNQILLANDAAGDGGQVLGTITVTNSLPVGAGLTATQTVTLPSLVGSRFLGITVNSGNNPFELDLTNNTAFATSPISINAPDLVLAQLTAPASAQFGQTFTLQFAVTNEGSAAATAVWNDQLYFSSTSNSLTGATTLATLGGASPLAAGAGYTQTQTVTLPLTTSSAPGTYYLTALADSGDAVFESTKTNNSLTVPISLVLPPLPDLTVGPIATPATAFAGQVIPIAYGITNMGAAPATGPWLDSVYLVPASLTLAQFSTNPAAWTLLGTFTDTNTLAAGASVALTRSVTIPTYGLAGDVRVAVIVDSDNSVIEQSGVSNIGLATNDLTVPTALSLTLTVTNVVKDTPTPALNCLLTRNGDLTDALGVSLVSSAPNDLMVPASVTIPAGVASVPFTAVVLDDGQPGPNVLVALAASADTYLGATGQVEIVNTDLPELTLTLATNEVTEGQSVVATLTSTTVSSQPVTVTLSSSSSSALQLPAGLTLPANSNAVSFTVQTVQNSVIAPTQVYTLNVSAVGYLGSSTSLSVLNDNAPTLTLALDRTNINEADGPFAAVATLSRQPVTSQAVTLDLSSSNPGAALVPGQLTIPALQGSVTFSVAAVNTTNITGPEFSRISAQALDDVGNAVGSPASEGLTIQDNHGPVLHLTIANKVVPKGVDPATMAAVWTTTPPTNDLIVTLTSSATGEATVPPTVTIPAGQTNATFLVTSVDDGIPFTSQTMSLTASATNYASGSDVLTVTDLGLPELVVQNLAVPSVAYTGEPLTIAYTLLNQGLGTLTNVVTQNIYLTTSPGTGNNLLVGTINTTDPLDSGQSTGETVIVPGSALPAPGTYWVEVVADVNNAGPELSTAYATTVSSEPLVIAPEYSAVVNVGTTNFVMGAPVPLFGSATLTVGGTATNVPVNILINKGGLQRVIGVFTDNQGNFSTFFHPLPGEAGNYTVSAVSPGITSAPAQAQFNLLGMSLNPSSLGLSVTAGGSVGASVSLQNLTSVPLTGLTATINGLAASLTASATLDTSYLAAQGSVGLSLTIWAMDANIYQNTFYIHLASAEGVVVDLPVTVTVNPLVPKLVAVPGQLVTSMLEGSQTVLQFAVVNTGGAASGPLNVILPSVPWMGLVSMNPLPSLAPGQTNLVTLVLSPGTNLALGPYSGNLAVNGSGTSVEIPFNFDAVSDAHGSLLVQSVDEYTFYAAGGPPLTNANVTVTDPFSGAVVASGVTGTNGLFLATNLVAGTYGLTVTASQHSSFSGSAVVTAGLTNVVQTFLSLQTVSYTWTVVPTTIQDQTQITIQTTFQTDVPAPVIVPSPASIDLSPLTSPGQYLDVPLTLANEGLIGVSNVTISVNSSALYRFDLVTTQIGALPAHGTVTVPMRITLLSSANPQAAIFANAMLVTPEAGTGPCTPSLAVAYSYPCGPYGVDAGVQLPVFNAQSDCASPPSPSGGTSVSVTGGGGGGGGGAASITTPSITIPSSCDPCLAKRLAAVGECILSFITIPIDTLQCFREGYECAGGIKENCIEEFKPTCGVAADQCILGAVECSGKLGKAAVEKIPWVGQALNIIQCSYDICTACDGLAGYGGLCGTTRTTSTPNALLAMHPLAAVAAASGGAGTVDAVSQAFVTTMLAQAGDLQSAINPYLYFFGSSDWFETTDTNALASLLNLFDTDIQTNSDGAQFISTGERAALLALPLPPPLAPADLNAFLDRWNLTMSNYNAGIFYTSQVPAGGDTNFIDFQQWISFVGSSVQILQNYQNEGYTDPGAAWFVTRNSLLVNAQGGASGTCAEITLQIDQSAVLTENAFHATLQLNNNGSEALTNVYVALDIQNQFGQDVTSLFGIQTPVLSGGLSAVDGTGLLAPNAAGTAQWTLLPSLQAAPQSPTNYLVSGSLNYTEGGVAVTIPLAPQSITVQPSPQLYLTYFLQRDVFADDPFTPEIEPSIPFPLAVMVQNKGYGTAGNFQITSAQPQIVDNAKGLLINFNIIGTSLDDQPVSPSLTLNFGDIAPGAIEIGDWYFTSSLEGLFTSYSATFENADAMGNLDLSPIQSVQIHEITHQVQADRDWDDGLPDFLVINTNDINSLPNQLYLSDGTVQPVSVVQTGSHNGPPTPGNLQVQFTANFPPGFAYVLVPDPANGGYPLQAVLYPDGTSFLTNNFWITDRKFIGMSKPPLLQTNLQLFIYHTNAGPDTLTLVYGAPSNAPQTNPPVSSVYSLPAQSPTTFGVAWSGESLAGQAPIAYYTIYVSVNNGPFTLWQGQTTGTGALYNGIGGHTYAFYSVATDTAGNREATPLQAQAQTTVVANTTPPSIAAITNVTLTPGQTLSLAVTATPGNPLNNLAFSLGAGVPMGMVINPTTGQITWTTSPAFSGTTNIIKVIATDNGQPPLSSTQQFTVFVLPVTVPVTLVSSENPSGYKDSVSFTASVAPAATGNVVFLTNGVALGTAPLVNGSATSAATTFLPHGTNTVTAVYSGDSEDAANTSTLLQVVTNQPPVASPLFVTRTAGTTLKIPLSSLATNWSDAYGLPVSLIGVNFTSTNGQHVFALNLTTNKNGTYVITNTAYLGYVNPSNVNDQITYAIGDGLGDTNEGWINIVVSTSPLFGQTTGVVNPNGKSVTLNFAGQPGYRYSVQRSLNLATWVTIWTTNAPPAGPFKYTDTFGDLGGAVPASAYYRLTWNP